MSGEVRIPLDAWPGSREVGLPHTLVDYAGARSFAEVVVDGTRDAVLRVAVPRPHCQDDLSERAVLNAVVGAGAVAAEAVACVEDFGGREVAGVVRFVPVSVGRTSHQAR